MVVIINGNNIHGKEELHDTLQAQLGLDQTYGRNLDALWDCLTGSIPMPLTIQWLDFHASRKSLGEYADRLLDLMREAEEEVENFTFDVKV
ncbi:barstar family protein [Paenibacillus polymyxa]|uniref:Barstar-like protein ribonuclease inhibitor n=1 Tax=Paenibacillus polymyxa TaxID=1406 RepID=A0A0F0GAL4_PAEPO|nr:MULTISPECIES: barstar family protein [Paenibacillus]AHM66833.1 barstar-like protein ribonuclease (barnase) inhibitor [Paenibacillus polymyxa SQR-21]AIY07731.1 barnase inhibitor [Paenibacillus polymyxa]KAF6586222.1 barstar family protein [Paenibacillus sp. EKM211P]KAF6617358.1 barstar family protein [Paenibacillus sp. EKM101P]KAF6622310.1 barstar family protein [Paenibacillus sp. EKM102P]